MGAFLPEELVGSFARQGRCGDSLIRQIQAKGKPKNTGAKGCIKQTKMLLRHCSEAAFFFQFFDKAIIDEIFGL